ncbi:hypothetical protein GCM10020367_58790 [Streptomyces sannanensis]|uniref:SGNH/GDSL hydrolase family protein n=1 Tax=Streptomyces sannanensis TaxID=285536 RepID=A0ABP6SK55_9ACTN
MHPFLMPVVAAQALYVRMSTEALPPAGGPDSGTVGEVAGAEPLRVAVIGESTAAGCGVERQEEGFTGQFARELSVRTGRPAAWSVRGRYGATARRIRYRLLPELDSGLHVVALLAGATTY